MSNPQPIAVRTEILHGQRVKVKVYEAEPPKDERPYTCVPHGWHVDEYAEICDRCRDVSSFPDQECRCFLCRLAFFMPGEVHCRDYSEMAAHREKAWSRAEIPFERGKMWNLAGFKEARELEERIKQAKRWDLTKAKAREERREEKLEKERQAEIRQRAREEAIMRRYRESRERELHRGPSGIERTAGDITALRHAHYREQEKAMEMIRARERERARIAKARSYWGFEFTVTIGEGGEFHAGDVPRLEGE